MLNNSPATDTGEASHPDREEAAMKQIDVSVHGLPLDYQMADNIARSVAHLLEREPTVVAWHDAVEHRMSPVIEGADIAQRWHDYGESHGGDFSVSVNGDYDFIFADSANFDKLEEGPYIALHDGAGHEYLCLPEHLRDRQHPDSNACLQVDDTGVSALHEG